MDQHGNLTIGELKLRQAHVNAIKALLDPKSKHNLDDEADLQGENAVEGGPKTSETPEDSVSSKEFFDVLDISSDMTEDQREQIKAVLWKNKKAFALDGGGCEFNPPHPSSW